MALSVVPHADPRSLEEDKKGPPTKKFLESGEMPLHDDVSTGCMLTYHRICKLQFSGLCIKLGSSRRLVELGAEPCNLIKLEWAIFRRSNASCQLSTEMELRENGGRGD